MVLLRSDIGVTSLSVHILRLLIDQHPFISSIHHMLRQSKGKKWNENGISIQRFFQFSPSSVYLSRVERTESLNSLSLDYLKGARKHEERNGSEFRSVGRAMIKYSLDSMLILRHESERERVGCLLLLLLLASKIASWFQLESNLSLSPTEFLGNLDSTKRKYN